MRIPGLGNISIVVDDEDQRPIDKITTAEFIEVYGLDLDRARQALSSLNADEIAVLYAAGVHFSGGCCPYGLREANNRLGAKLSACSAPGIDERKRIVSAKHAAIDEQERQAKAAARRLTGPHAEDEVVSATVARDIMRAQVFGGGGDPGSRLN